MRLTIVALIVLMTAFAGCAESAEPTHEYTGPLVDADTIYSNGECRTVVTLDYGTYTETHTFDQQC